MVGLKKEIKTLKGQVEGKEKELKVLQDKYEDQILKKEHENEEINKRLE